ncbi:D-alanine--D-alanine ligase-like protein [Drosera capensis]
MASLSALHLHPLPLRRRSPFSSHPLPSSISLPFSSLSHSEFIPIACRHRRIGARSIGTEIDVETRRFEEDEGEEDERRVLRVGVVCGGPSVERGISLSSARLVLDHLQSDYTRVSCYYIDTELNAFAISPAQVYSNTPADFDFKLGSLARGFPSLSDFSEHLAASVDIVFPVIHGYFGEDGGLQEILEKSKVPYVDTRSNECRIAFDKYEASLELDKQGFFTVPSLLVKGSELNESGLAAWFQQNQLDTRAGKVVVKLARAGSSIDVTVAYGVADAFKKAHEIISEGIDDKVVVEIFLDSGREFTAIVLDVGNGVDCQPVALPPIESISCSELYSLCYGSVQVSYHTPPHFCLDVMASIREGASLLFERLGLCDFARIDGWYLPSPAPVSFSGQKFGRTNSGFVLFTDINLISGMEQISFLVQQASKVGLSHPTILRSIVLHACKRFHNLSFYDDKPRYLLGRSNNPPSKQSFQHEKPVRKVFVIFGGDTSERQLEVIPCLLAPTTSLYKEKDDKELCMSSKSIWNLLCSLVLRHTTEEVLTACIEASEPVQAAVSSELRKQVMNDLLIGLREQKWFSGFDVSEEQAVRYLLKDWIELAKLVQATVFIAVHGGIGEDGTLQSLLEAEGVPYTGLSSSSLCSTCCTLHAYVFLDLVLFDVEGPGVQALVATSLALKHLCCGSGSLCEGIAGQAVKNSSKQLFKAKVASSACDTFLFAFIFFTFCTLQAHGTIEMSNPLPKHLIFEPFIETDEIKVSSKSHQLIWEGKSRWVGVTVGVIGKCGSMHALSPSSTVKESGEVLSLEEKFQGGTGINLTPPPASIMRFVGRNFLNWISSTRMSVTVIVFYSIEEALKKCKRRIELIAGTLQLERFSRIDAFVNVDSGEVLVIEVNTVPGMTPSTVLIHQALAEQPPMYPH